MARAFKRALLDDSPPQAVQAAPGAECIRFVFGDCYPVNDLSDLSAAGHHPPFISNVFDDSDTFPGYEGLDIAIFVTAGSLKHYVQITYDTKGEMDILGCMKRNVYEDSLIEEMEEFVKVVQEGFTPTGDLVETINRGKDVFEVYRNSMTTPGFLEYHKRLRTLPVWFIDGGSIVISTEPHWIYFTLYQRVAARYRLVGLAGCYIYYQSLDRCRVRISQVLVLPQYQRQGYGMELLKCVYKEFRKDPAVFEITVEDSSPEMQCLRDLCDLKDAVETGLLVPRNMKPGFQIPISTLSQLQTRLKITANQLHRVSELIQYALLDPLDSSAVITWRKSMKRRLLAANFEELRPKVDKVELKHIYIREIYADDDSDSESNDEMMQRLMQDIGPMQGVSSAILNELKQVAGQKRAERQYLPPNERTLYSGFEKLREYYEEQKQEYDVVRDKVVEVLRPYLA